MNDESPQFDIHDSLPSQKRELLAAPLFDLSVSVNGKNVKNYLKEENHAYYQIRLAYMPL